MFIGALLKETRRSYHICFVIVTTVYRKLILLSIYYGYECQMNYEKSTLITGYVHYCQVSSHPTPRPHPVSGLIKISVGDKFFRTEYLTLEQNCRGVAKSPGTYHNRQVMQIIYSLCTSIQFILTCPYCVCCRIQSCSHDVVLLHHCGKGPHAPSLSPFILKLETFFKMAEIPYQVCTVLNVTNKIFETL